MTFSNGTYSPNPLANPLNTRLGASNISFNPLSNQRYSVNKPPESKDLQVPNQDVPMYGTPEWNQKYNAVDDLQVPNQDIPLGDQNGRNGFIKNSSIFRCLDGTIVDFKTRKIIYSPNDPKSDYWGNSDRVIFKGNANSWNTDTETKDDSLNYNDDQQISRESAKYWIQAQEEASKLQSQMTIQQKEMIAQFERHFPKSKLIEECKRFQSSVEKTV